MCDGRSVKIGPNGDAGPNPWGRGAIAIGGIAPPGIIGGPGGIIGGGPPGVGMGAPGGPCPGPSNPGGIPAIMPFQWPNIVVGCFCVQYIIPAKLPQVSFSENACFLVFAAEVHREQEGQIPSRSLPDSPFLS